MKKFNVTGTCIPEKHYMVNTISKIKAIKRMVDQEEYFTINRGRQYGKTTTLMLLEEKLDEYIVLSISFEGLGTAKSSSEAAFCQEFIQLIVEALEFITVDSDYKTAWNNSNVKDFSALSTHITQMCKGQKVVLMIDEVDKLLNTFVFLDFLGVLRKKYLARQKNRDFTFHSVILAGVYDVRNMKRNMVNKGIETSIGAMNNSPWNIAVDFDVDMSFNSNEIETMLKDYEQDAQTGMDISKIAAELYDYTGGYPVLVSYLCKIIDESQTKNWSSRGIQDAIKKLIDTKIPLFESLGANLENNPDVYQLMYDVLILGLSRGFTFGISTINLAHGYGYIRNWNGRCQVSNKIFEIFMTNFFIEKDKSRPTISTSGFISQVTQGGRFNMPLCLERFKLHWQEVHNQKTTDQEFYETHYRIIFLSFLKPLLNGVGFYEIESRTSDDARMDVVVIYGKDKFIIELKKWKGQIYNEKGVHQLLSYMDKANLEKGYLLTFDFRNNPQPHESNWRQVGEKQIFEVRVGG